MIGWSEWEMSGWSEGEMSCWSEGKWVVGVRGNVWLE